MQILLYIFLNLPAAVTLVAAVYLFVNRKKNLTVRMTMALLLAVLALCLICYAQLFNPVLMAHQSWGFEFMYTLLTPFIAPLYFLFVNKLTVVERTPVANVLAFTPAFVYAILLITAQALLSDAERHAYICNVILGESIQTEGSAIYNMMVFVGDRLFKVLVPVQTILVMIYGEFKLTEYVSRLRDFYASKNEGDAVRVRGIHTLTILVSVLFLCISMIPVNEGVEDLWIVLPVVVVEIILMLAIVSYSIRVEYSAANLHEMINGDEPVAADDIPNENADDTSDTFDPQVAISKTLEPVPSLISRLDDAMERERMYLDPSLSLVSLSEHVGSNRTYVAKALKESKSTNFSDYVNHYRMEYALNLMKATPKDKISIQNIAVACGCGSIQTFYRLFKTYYNETPTQWFEKNK